MLLNVAPPYTLVPTIDNWITGESADVQIELQGGVDQNHYLYFVGDAEFPSVKVGLNTDDVPSDIQQLVVTAWYEGYSEVAGAISLELIVDGVSQSVQQIAELAFVYFGAVQVSISFTGNWSPTSEFQLKWLENTPGATTGNVLGVYDVVIDAAFVPATPDLSLACPNFQTINATWDAPADEPDHFEIDVATDAGFADIIQSIEIAGDETSYAITGLAQQTQYWVRIRGTNDATDPGAYASDSIVTIAYDVTQDWFYAVPTDWFGVEGTVGGGARGLMTGGGL
jgi:hypothetical protein